MLDFDLNDITDAIRKNGYRKIKGEYILYRNTDNKPIAGCAIGQAALNLNVPPDELRRLLDDYMYVNYVAKYRFGVHECPIKSCSLPWERPMGDLIVHLNDGHNLSLARIADYIEKLGAENVASQ